MSLAKADLRDGATRRGSRRSGMSWVDWMWGLTRPTFNVTITRWGASSEMGRITLSLARDTWALTRHVAREGGTG